MIKTLCIIGSGKMAVSILRGVCESYETEVVARDEKKLKELKDEFKDKISVSKLQNSYNIEAKNLILCVKPHALDEVGSQLSGRANSLLSVMAGVSLEKLRYSIDAAHTLRAMPNLAATYGKSMTTVCGDESFKDEALQVCSTFGTALWLGSEKEIDIATALAGSGPAFLALVAEALSDGAVKEGLKREDAKILTCGLFDGFAALIKDNHPALLKDSVMSPGGTTAAGIGALEEKSVRDAFIKAIHHAYERAKELKG